MNAPLDSNIELLAEKNFIQNFLYRMLIISLCAPNIIFTLNLGSNCKYKLEIL